MFPCSNISDNLYSFSDQTNKENPNLKEQQHLYYSSSYLQFPELFLEDDELFLNQLLSQNQFLVSEIPHQDPTKSSNIVPNVAEDIDNETANYNTSAQQQISLEPNLRNDKAANEALIPRKRSTGKKDRHSKIYTAQGPRDRRMRLSLPIARKFFDLQDMLRFDKASKTIDWLYTKSMASIKEVRENLSLVKQTSSDGAKSVSTAESEVVSSKAAVQIAEISYQKGLSGKGAENLIGKAREKRSRELHKVAKESRDIARARARERTREKMKMKGSEELKEEFAENSSSSKSAGTLCSSHPTEKWWRIMFLQSENEDFPEYGD
ncbi:transcription factor CYCLOIDEA-like [Quillaja saponaria]|uniref:Transcription factor CYCLOIDEA-like n=1 Tax=Quillaja saponaria TaxID=32244 RepID=A0AAD7KQ60_QUISA|nr:transcription factor CYCLOIDEA-like [Quillaja saponaria]